ncbi:pre-peptidase C-terminal domain-containing protein [Cohnella sp. OV330]|uniref:pre-peptidase C-terminal domain-containing protein n=1 Tax=Cohnella sp. OV330 TaxID=1855288 RepID=UPI0008ED2A27|nr:pre-peptidase C-terminal domain-containing protein [Cohnella sp. OV330]SFB62812.1 pre-peptidase C-terminal domain-containing protein [Cohnella sp. OV330]
MNGSKKVLALAAALSLTLGGWSAGAAPAGVGGKSEGTATPGVAVAVPRATTKPRLPDVTPPGEALGLTAAYANGEILLSWRLPTDKDYDHANLYVKEPGAPDFELHEAGIASEPADGDLPTSFSASSVGSGSTGLMQTYALAAPLTGLYEVKLTSMDRTGNESAGTLASAQAAPDAQGQAAVTDADATAQAADFIVTWTDPADPGFRRVQVRIEAAEGGAYDRSFLVGKGEQRLIVSGLTAGEYTVELTAYDAFERASPTVRFSASSVDVTPPAESGALRAEDLAGTAQLTWAPPSEDGDYASSRLYVRYPGQAEYTRLASDLAAGSYEVPGLRAGAHQFKLTSVDPAGNESAGAIVALAIGDYEAPQPVSAATVALQGPRVELAWTDPSDPDLAQVRIRIRSSDGAAYDRSFDLQKGVQRLRSEALPEGDYEISLTALDAASNASSAVRLSAHALADATEPNGSVAEAKLLALPDFSVQASLSDAQDTDYYVLPLKTPSKISLTLRNEAASEMELRLSDRSGMRVYRKAAVAAGTVAQEEVTLGAGYYYVKISGGAATGTPAYYELEGGTGDFYEPNNAREQATVLSANALRTISTIDRPGDVDWYRIDADRTGPMSVQLRNLPMGTNYDLYLTDDAGTALGESRSLIGSQETITFNATASRHYYVYVQSASGYSLFPYTLETTNREPDALEPNDTPASATPVYEPYAIELQKHGSIHYGGDSDYYRFEVAKAAEPFSFTAPANVSLQLLDAEASPYGVQPVLYEQNQVISTKLNPGTYYVRVYASSLVTEPVPYDLTFRFPAGSLPRPVYTVSEREQKLVAYWAPDFMQDIVSVRQGGYSDMFTDYFFDGQTNPSYKWFNFKSGWYNRPSVVYHSYQETDTHCFIGYYLYYPSMGFTGVMLVIYKDGSEYGKLQLVRTKDKAYSDNSQISDLEGGIFRAGHRPVLSVTGMQQSTGWGGSGPDTPTITMFEGDLRDQPPGGTGIKYFHGGTAMEVTDINNWAAYSYRLLPMKELFDNEAVLDYEFKGVWGLYPSSFGFVRGAFPWKYEQDMLSDPAFYVDRKHDYMGGFSHKYIDNAYYHIGVQYMSVAGLEDLDSFPDNPKSDLIVIGDGINKNYWKKNNVTKDQFYPIFFGEDDAQEDMDFVTPLSTRYLAKPSYARGVHVEVADLEDAHANSAWETMGTFDYPLQPGEQATWIGKPLSMVDGKVLARITFRAWRVK